MPRRQKVQSTLKSAFRLAIDGIELGLNRSNQTLTESEKKRYLAPLVQDLDDSLQQVNTNLLSLVYLYLQVQQPIEASTPPQTEQANCVPQEKYDALQAQLDVAKKELPIEYLQCELRPTLEPTSTSELPIHSIDFIGAVNLGRLDKLLRGYHYTLARVGDLMFSNYTDTSLLDRLIEIPRDIEQLDSCIKYIFSSQLEDLTKIYIVCNLLKARLDKGEFKIPDNEKEAWKAFSNYSTEETILTLCTAHEILDTQLSLWQNVEILDNELELNRIHLVDLGDLYEKWEHQRAFWKDSKDYIQRQFQQNKAKAAKTVNETLLESEVKELKTKVSSLDKENKELKAETKTLNSSIERIKADHLNSSKLLKLENADLKARIEEFTSTQAQSSDKSDHSYTIITPELITNLESTYNNLEAGNNYLQCDLEHPATKLLKRAQRKIQSLEEDIARNKTNNEEVKQALRSTIADLRAELKDLKASTSSQIESCVEQPYTGIDPVVTGDMAAYFSTLTVDSDLEELQSAIKCLYADDYGMDLKSQLNLAGEPNEIAYKTLQAALEQYYQANLKSVVSIESETLLPAVEARDVINIRSERNLPLQSKLGVQAIDVSAVPVDGEQFGPHFLPTPFGPNQQGHEWHYCGTILLDWYERIIPGWNPKKSPEQLAKEQQEIEAFFAVLDAAKTPKPEVKEAVQEIAKVSIESFLADPIVEKAISPVDLTIPDARNLLANYTTFLQGYTTEEIKLSTGKLKQLVCEIYYKYRQRPVQAKPVPKKRSAPKEILMHIDPKILQGLRTRLIEFSCGDTWKDLGHEKVAALGKTYDHFGNQGYFEYYNLPYEPWRDTVKISGHDLAIRSAKSQLKTVADKYKDQ